MKVEYYNLRYVANLPIWDLVFDLNKRTDSKFE